MSIGDGDFDSFEEKMSQSLRPLNSLLRFDQDDIYITLNWVKKVFRLFRQFC